MHHIMFSTPLVYILFYVFSSLAHKFLNKVFVMHCLLSKDLGERTASCYDLDIPNNVFINSSLVYYLLLVDYCICLNKLFYLEVALSLF